LLLPLAPSRRWGVLFRFVRHSLDRWLRLRLFELRRRRGWHRRDKRRGLNDRFGNDRFGNDWRQRLGDHWRGRDNRFGRGRWWSD
jgi:hypothetical protein